MCTVYDVCHQKKINFLFFLNTTAYFFRFISCIYRCNNIIFFSQTSKCMNLMCINERISMCLCMDELMCCSNSHWSLFQQSKVSSKRTISIQNVKWSHFNIKNLTKVQNNESTVNSISSIERQLFNSRGISMIKYYWGVKLQFCSMNC